MENNLRRNSYIKINPISIRQSDDVSKFFQVNEILYVRCIRAVIVPVLYLSGHSLQAFRDDPVFVGLQYTDVLYFPEL